jgi:phosphoribosylformylglycinamidine synthase
VKHFRVNVQIIPRKGLLDPQGKAVADALHTLGFAGVRDVHVGRHLVIESEAADAAAAEASVREMCTRLLANPVTEDFVIAGVAGA